MEQRFLSTGDIGRYCGVHFRTVLRWIQKGHLKAHRLPGGRGDNRVLLEDFLDFLHRHQMPVPAELQAAPRRVLVVEDDRNMARGIERVLRRAGFETRIALDGLQAGVELKAFCPTVMTLDLRMPGLDGFEVLRFIRSTPDLAGLRILVVSGLAGAELRRALVQGADAVLAKPFANETLVSEVTRLAQPLADAAGG